MKTRIVVQPDDFNLDREIAALAAGGEAGAVASFIGHVRKEGNLDNLTLEHYPHMTEAQIARIVEEAGAHWPLTGITVIHRIGSLKPADRIVLVAVASQHRRAAFEACEFVMDFLKSHAPFWKEESRGQDRHWVEARAADDAALKRWKP